VKQVVQQIGGGPVQVLDVPTPQFGPTEVLVRTEASIISAGTERAITSLAQSNLLAKAKARPDLVRKVVARAKVDGIAATVANVRGRLAEDLPLGYSAAGRVLAVGENVVGIVAGDLVATAGAGWANHAETQAVPGLLCSVVPSSVTAEDAAFATIASIALHGLRLAEVGVGSKVVVQGAGLVGQIAARLATAAGCDVIALDVSPDAVAGASNRGIHALVDSGPAATALILDWSRGRGADAVLVCAAGHSSEIVGRVPALCRDRATVVIVGDVGLSLSRTPFYEKELTLRFARSYGPGRYDREYEQWGVDYPAGQVRWTEGRNLEAVLDLLVRRRLIVSDLVTHRFPIERAAEAYDLIESRREPYVAIAIEYPRAATTTEHIDGGTPTARPSGAPARPLAIGWLGAGNFSTGVLLPAFKTAGFTDLLCVASTRGVSATRMAESGGFLRAVSGSDEVINDPNVGTVVIATPHDSHGRLVEQALRAGKNVWCEKPLALSSDDLDLIEAAAPAGGVLAVGFNRRFAPATAAVRRALPVGEPRFVIYRVAAGVLPEKHWYHDRRKGGRLLGEVCHFVDTASALIGADPVDVVSVGAGRPHETLLADDLSVTMRYPDGSMAVIVYTSAAGGWGKEYVEVVSGTYRAVIDDYRSATVNGKNVWKGRQDKGHKAAVAQFKSDVVRGESDITAASLATSRAVIAAAASLLQSG
jgi:predicted dehydrogenase/threonine dehydrogenase-like Zn-dependent dehydrogenase